MSIRYSHGVVWLVGVLTVTLTIGTLLLTFVGGAASAAIDVTDLVGSVLYTISPLVASVFGTLIVLRQPLNPVGWLLGGVGLAIALEAFVQAYAVYALIVRAGAAPGAVIAAVLANALWPVGWPFIVLFMLVFPNGRLLSRRWRPVAWLAVAVPGLLVLISAVYPGPLLGYATSTNPIGLTGGAGALIRQVDPAIVGNATLLLLVAAVVSIICRFRRATGEERQQLKWLAYAGVLVVAAQVVAVVALPRTVGNLVSNLSFFGIPVAISVAMFRYRLYDIDRIIRRTLVYGALTAFLAAVYFGGVVLLQQLFRALTGQQSDLAIAGSTLAIAALFQPLRLGIQAFIDRQFYRQTYDTARVLTTFAATVRDEIELTALLDSLVTVVEDTMQPTSLSLWLPEARRATSNHAPDGKKQTPKPAVSSMAP